MSDPIDPIEDPTAEESAAVDVWFARVGDAAFWADRPHDLEARVVEAVAIEMGSEAADDAAADAAAAPTSLGRVRAMRDATGVPWWLGAAAALVAVVGGLALISRGGDDGTVFALTGTDAAPDATGELVVSATPAGLKLLLDPDGLPGAPEGTYYEAWVTDGDVRVSAGTFHLRDGDAQIELWAGVVGPEFNQLAITLEPVDGDNGSSGDAYLSGRFSIDD